MEEETILEPTETPLEDTNVVEPIVSIPNSITILNIHDSEVGLPNYKTFSPQETITILVTEEEYANYTTCPYVQILATATEPISGGIQDYVYVQDAEGEVVLEHVEVGTTPKRRRTLGTRKS